MSDEVLDAPTFTVVPEDPSSEVIDADPSDIPLDLEGPPQEGNPDGVFVAKVVEEDGTIRTVVQPVGNVQVTEIQTILELGVAHFREAIGLK